MLHRAAHRSGQSLIEVLVAAGVGTILLVGTVSLIAPALRGNSQAQYTQAGAGLARELLDNVRVWTDGNWSSLYSLSKGSGNHYYLSASSSPFVAVAGNESVAVGTTTYTRFFYVENVNRSAGFIAAVGGTDDPSTQKVTIGYVWPQVATRTISVYLTRSRARLLWQTDWVGGSGQDGPATTINNKFSSASNLDVTTTTGSLRITGI